MMDMMNSTGMVSSFVFLWGLHVLSVIAFFVGVLFLILWAAKALAPSQMKTWGIGLVVAGTVVCLFTIAARGGPWIGGGFGHTSGMMIQRGMMENMMDEMEEHDEREASDHQGAIDMAEMALESAKHEEIKAMARAIISAQQQEIEQMEQWLKAWGYTK